MTPGNAANEELHLLNLRLSQRRVKDAIFWDGRRESRAQVALLAWLKLRERWRQ